MAAIDGRMIPLALALMAVAVPASDARAQGNTFNPYGNSGYADYREFGSPKYANDPSLPGQALLNSEPLIPRPRANSFQQYADSLQGNAADPVPGSSASRGASAGVPYFRSFRQYDREYNRVYRPNADADKGYDARIKQRNQAYAKALEEKDPIKRARMVRQIEQDSLDRPIAPTRPRAGAPAPAANGATAAPAPATRAPSPLPAPADRRNPAPSPFPSNARSAAPNPATRAPATRAPAPPRAAAPAPPAEAPIGPPPDPSTIPIPPPR